MACRRDQAGWFSGDIRDHVARREFPGVIRRAIDGSDGSTRTAIQIGADVVGCDAGAAGGIVFQGPLLDGRVNLPEIVEAAAGLRIVSRPVMATVIMISTRVKPAVRGVLFFVFIVIFMFPTCMKTILVMPPTHN